MSSIEYTRLPDSRSRRKVIMVLSPTEIDELDTNPEMYQLLNREDLAIVDASLDVDQADPLTQRLERFNLLQVGATLVANPYRENDYVPLTDATDQLSLERWSMVSHLCGLLGAKSISVQVVENSKTGSTTTLEASGGKGPVTADVSGSRSTTDSFAASLDWRDEFHGGASDIEQARDFLAESGLGMDPEIRSLVESRDFDGNRLSRRRLVIDLSKDAERTVSVATNLSVPATLSVKAGLDTTKKFTAHYKVTMEVSFAE